MKGKHVIMVHGVYMYVIVDEDYYMGVMPNIKFGMIGMNE